MAPRHCDRALEILAHDDNRDLGRDPARTQAQVDACPHQRTCRAGISVGMMHYRTAMTEVLSEVGCDLARTCPGQAPDRQGIT